MADDTTASIITLHQPPPKRAKTPAERAKAYRQRKKAKVPALPVAAQVPTTVSEPDNVAPVTPVPLPAVALGVVTPSRFVTQSRLRIAPILLTASAFALAGVGMIMNGWFARSLGSSDFADTFSSPLAWPPI